MSRLWPSPEEPRLKKDAYSLLAFLFVGAALWLGANNDVARPERKISPPVRLEGVLGFFKRRATLFGGDERWLARIIRIVAEIQQRCSNPHVIGRKDSLRAVSDASWQVGCGRR